MADHDIVYDTIMGATNIRQVMSSSFEPNAQAKRGRNSGAFAASAIYGAKVNPKAMFATADLYTLLGLTNLFAAGINGTSSTFTMPWQKRQQGTPFAGDGANFTISASNWHAICAGISASEDSDPVANMEVFFRSTDGRTDPVSENVNQTLAAQTYIGEYAFGPIEVNDVFLTDPIGFRFNPAVQVVTSGKNGLNFPVRSYPVVGDPVIEVQFRDFDDAANFAASFKVMTSAAVYLRKRSGVGFVADGTAQHIKISLGAGLIVSDGKRAQGREAGVATVQLHGLAASYSRASAIA